jgi:hypothetical protein
MLWRKNTAKPNGGEAGCRLIAVSTARHTGSARTNKRRIEFETTRKMISSASRKNPKPEAHHHHRGHPRGV